MSSFFEYTTVLCTILFLQITAKIIVMVSEQTNLSVVEVSSFQIDCQCKWDPLLTAFIDRLLVPCCLLTASQWLPWQQGAPFSGEEMLCECCATREKHGCLLPGATWKWLFYGFVFCLPFESQDFPPFFHCH